MMKIVRTVAELRAQLRPVRLADRSIGLVPTMGWFHDGHLSLMHAARRDCDVVVVSLFVNPTQFGPTEDLTAYPRDEARDARLAEQAGADILFAPSPQEVYPEGFATSVEVHGISEVLCGDPSRRGAGHFAGVTLVVSKLFNMVQPEVAYFGQKDAQQAMVVQRMVRDLNIPVRVQVCPTVREVDGLAMSSRNVYLQPADRERAAAINRALGSAEAAYRRGERDPAAVVDVARTDLLVAGIEPEYLELRAADDLSVLDRIDRPALLAVAAMVGRARLIDNRILDIGGTTGGADTRTSAADVAAVGESS